MSDTPSHGPVKYIMPKWIRGPQDFVGGLAMVAIAVFALWASSDLQGMRGFSFGAGTAPRMFAFLLLGLGIAVTIVGLVTDGEHITIPVRTQLHAGDPGGRDRGRVVRQRESHDGQTDEREGFWPRGVIHMVAFNFGRSLTSRPQK